MITAVVLSLLALTSTSFAGNKNNNDDKSQKKSRNFQKFVQQAANPAQMLRQPLLGDMSNDSYTFKKSKKHRTHNKQDDNINNTLPVAPGSGGVPIDPGRGDGRVPVEPATPQGKPGFVWVNGHWERARATSSPTTGGPPPVANGGGGVTVTSANSKPVIRDHRTGGSPPVANGGGGVTVTSTNSGPVIRDHRTGIVTITPVPVPPQFGGQISNPPPVVLNPATTQPSPSRGGGGGRPRFEQNRAPGGVTVSVVPGSQRPNDVTGVGGSPIDSVVESVIGIFGGGGITPAGSQGRR
jgi:hypothetical protein